LAKGILINRNLFLYFLLRNPPSWIKFFRTDLIIMVLLTAWCKKCYLRHLKEGTLKLLEQALCWGNAYNGLKYCLESRLNGFWTFFPLPSSVYSNLIIFIHQNILGYPFNQ